MQSTAAPHARRVTTASRQQRPTGTTDCAARSCPAINVTFNSRSAACCCIMRGVLAHACAEASCRKPAMPAGRASVSCSARASSAATSQAVAHDTNAVIVEVAPFSARCDSSLSCDAPASDALLRQHAVSRSQCATWQKAPGCHCKGASRQSQLTASIRQKWRVRAAARPHLASVSVIGAPSRTCRMRSRRCRPECRMLHHTTHAVSELVAGCHN